MTRLVDAFYSTPTDMFPGKVDEDAKIVNLQVGGQFGHMVDYQNLVSSTPYVRQHLIAVLVSAPRGFKYMPDSASWYRALRAIIEEQSNEITGLNATLKIENVEHAVGGAGEQISAVSNVTREQSTPTHRINEKYGMPVTTFVNAWITDLMMDPETKYPNIIVHRPELVHEMDHLVDFYSANVLYFEPDPVFRHINKAWFCAFVRPNSEGASVEGSRNITTAKEELQIDLQMSATSQVGLGVNAFAQTILNNLRKVASDPWTRAAYEKDISAHVNAPLGEPSTSGYHNGMYVAHRDAHKL